MALIPYVVNFGGGGGGDVSGDYKFTQNQNGELVLTYKGEPVSMMSPSGSWFNDSVSTGVGSLHLGGNESGGVAHSLSSCGQNVGFKNEFSKAVAGDKIFFYPTWQGVSCDGQTRYAATMRSYGPFAARNEVNGSPHASIAVPYNFTLEVTGSAGSGTETYSVTVIPSENYTGRLSNIIISNATGAEIYNTSVDVTAVAGSELKIHYKYPFSALSGDNLQLRLVKENGNYLQVMAGTTSTSIPWRALSNAAISSIEVASATGYANNRVMITDSNGRIGVSALQASKAVMSNANSAPVSSTTTSAELNSIGAAASVYSIGNFADGDAVYSRLGGQMKQMDVIRLFTYMRDKLNGAASTVLTTNLTANRMLVSGSTGKIETKTFNSTGGLCFINTDSSVGKLGPNTVNTVAIWDATGTIPLSANTTVSEVNQLSGTAANANVVVEDADRLIINDSGTIKQTPFSRLWEYIQSKITGAVSGILTSNLTANKMLISNASGKIETSSLGANQVAFIDSNGLLAGRSLVANRIMITDDNGLPTTTSAIGPVYWKRSISAAGTFNVVTAFNGGFTVNFVRTASTIYLQVTHTSLGGRYQYQTTVNSGTPSSFWTSSSGNNYPANLPAISTSGAAISGWLYGVDGDGQSTSIRVDFGIITNGMTNAVCYACVS